MYGIIKNYFSEFMKLQVIIYYIFFMNLTNDFKKVLFELKK